MSQADRILRILQAHPGRWVSCAEILREVSSVVHSRVNDLRRRGVVVEHRTVGAGAKGSEYRLSALAGAGFAEQRVAPELQNAPVPASASAVPVDAQAPTPGLESGALHSQLVLMEGVAA